MTDSDNYGRSLLGRKYFPSVVIDQIIDRISAGESVTSICSDPSMPCAASWFRWLTLDVALAARYEAARAAAKKTATA